MSLSDLASLGSFVSGIAVLISFVFLALQLRQANANQRALIQSGRAARVVETISHSTEPQLPNVMLRGMKGDPEMSPEDVYTFLQHTYATFLNFEDTYLQFRYGTIHAAAWEVGIERLQILMASPGWRAAWKKRRAMLNRDFAREVDEIVARARLSVYEDPTASWAADIAAEKAPTAAQKPGASHSPENSATG
jgi:hypothetical protein